MGSFVESDVAGTEIQNSPAKDKTQLNCGGEPIATDGASVVHAPPSVPVGTPSELSVRAFVPTENQPDGETAAPEAYKPEVAVFPASDAPVVNQPEGPAVPVANPPEASFFPASETPVVNQPEGPTAPVANQPEASVFPASETPVVNQPEGPTAPVANQPEASVFRASETPVVNQPETSVFPASETPVENQPEGSNGSGPAAPVANQPEGYVANVVVNQPEGVVVLSSDTTATYHDPAAYKPESAVPAAVVVNSVALDYQSSNGNGINGNSVGGSEMKRKRGRPRKYPLPGDSTDVPLLSIPPPPSDGLGMPQGSPPKKKRGRPVGSCTKHVAAATLPSPVSAFSVQAGAGFTPYTIAVGANEDVLARLISFAQINTEVVCVLSASGTISGVTLQHGLSSAGIVTYVGTFDILSLSGSFLLSESGGHRSRTGGLSVTLSTPDGRILGGAVAGPLHAQSPVQVIVGTFMAKDQQQVPRQGYNEDYSVIPRLNSSVGGSPATRPTLTESSGGLLGMFNPNVGGCNYPNQQNVPNVPWR